MKPRLIHPVTVRLFRRETAESDPDFGEVSAGWKEPVEIKGQVAWGKFEALQPSGAGDRPQCDGHIVFYADEWAKLGGVKGDEVELEGSGRLVIVEIAPKAHYGGRFWHVHVGFVRRRGS